jgi:hypothetical protein
MSARPAHSSHTRRSLVGWPAGLLALMLASVAWIRGGILFTWPLWLDEYHTVFLAEKGSVFRSMSDLAAGSDFNLPLLYLVERLLSHLTGGITPLSLRVTSFMTVWLAMVFVFFALRRHVSAFAAFIGAFIIWCNSIVVIFAFQGRFYGPWLLFCAMVLWSLGLDVEREKSITRDVALAVSSALVCTIHYYGIFSLTLIAAGAAAWIARTRRTYRYLLPIVAGPIALAACAPFFVGQRSAITVKTWVSPISLHQIREMLEYFFLAAPVVVVAIVLLASARWKRMRRASQPTRNRNTAVFLPFGALLLMPLVLVVMSIVFQPTMELRFAIPAVLAWAPIAGLAATRLPWPGKLSLLAVLFFFSVRAQDALAVQLRGVRSELKSEAAIVTPFLDSGRVVMVLARTSLYPMATATSRQRQLTYPDFTDSLARSRGFPAPMILERDVARIHQRLYGFPRLESIEQAYANPNNYVFVPLSGTAYTLSLLYPDARVTSVGPRMYKVGARDSTAARIRDDPVNQAVKALETDRNPAKALLLLDTVISRDRANYEALWYRARALEALNRKAEAIRAWRTVISEAEDHGWTLRLPEARDRLNHLACGPLSAEARAQIRLSVTAAVIQWFRCLQGNVSDARENF